MTFIRNRLFVPEFQRSPAYRARLRLHAEAVAAAANRKEPSRATGRVNVNEDVDGVRVEVRSPFWHIFEFGSVNNAPLAPLRTAVREVGLRLDEH